MNQRISLHDLFQLRTKHFVPIGRLKLELGQRAELYLDIKFLFFLSFIINEPICFFHLVIQPKTTYLYLKEFSVHA